MDFCFSEDVGKIGDSHGRILTWTNLKVRSRTESARQWEESADTDVMYPEINVMYLDRNQMDYAALVDDSKRRMQDPRLVQNCYHLVDATGVGMPVVDFMIRQGLSPIGIWITGGSAVNSQDYGYSVPKVDLINALQLSLSSGMLKFSKGLNQAHVSQLLHEFKTFKEKKTSKGAVTFAAWRESDHDDLVLSLAMNVWWMMRVHGIQIVTKRRFSRDDDYDPLRMGL